LRVIPPKLAFVVWCLGLLAQAGAALAQSVTASVPVSGGAIAVNPVTNRIYVASDAFNHVTVIDGATHATTTVPVGRGPQFIAVNTATNRIFVSNVSDASLSVIDGATLSVSTLPVGGSGPIVVDESRNRVYVLRRGNNGEVTIVDGASPSWYAINTGSHTPVALALDAAANLLYVSHYNSGDVRAIDMSSTSDHPPTVAILVAGRPSALALNPVTRKVYVLSDDSRGPIVEIDGATNAARRITAPGHASVPAVVAANPATNRIYAAFANELVVVDGATHALTYLPIGSAQVLAVDSAANKVYALVGNRTLVVIDGATHALTSIPVGPGASGIAVNPNTRRAYVSGDSVSVVAVGGAPPPPASYGANVQGLWWGSPAGYESGWGLNIAQQGNTVFATWFTYDTDGSAMWLVMPNGERGSGDTYSGDVYRTTGPAFGAAAFDPARVGRTVVGNASLSFQGPDDGVFSATVYGSRIYKSITRQVYAAPVPVCAAGGSAGAQPNYQDVWWSAPAGGESGWGLYVTHQGDNLFVTWFTYGPDGKAMWLVGSNVVKTANGTYSGTLYRTWGPPFNALPWNPSQVSVLPVGTVTLAFTDAGNGRFSYTALGMSQSKSITRQVFSAPATVCR
jgi:YVTN family beta-propeller protein